ncbi:MAG: uL15m family ribosomal protein [bacterium]|nr:MAG: uL15m family ribosomal protein [bacterium]
MSTKRLGRGYGSGKGGHTSSRGQKGQKSRTDIHILFEGLKVKKSTLKKFPLLRGRGKFLAKAKPLIIQADKLSVFKSKEKVTIETLIAKGLVDKAKAYKYGVKIVGQDPIKKDLEILVPVSKIK